MLKIDQAMRPHKIAVSIVCIVLLVAIFSAFQIGRTNAMFLSEDGILAQYSVGRISCQVTEQAKFENICVSNTGTAPAYVRAALVITWSDDAGNVYSESPTEAVDYSIEMGQKWIPGADGFYYYADKISSGHSTSALVVSAAEAPGSAPAGYHFDIQVVAQAIQANTPAAAQSAWGADNIPVAWR